MNARTDIRNAFTVDVEDYFQVSALAPYIARSRWDSIECRVERNVDRILALLADSGNRATFFTLGWIAERHPDMVKRIAAAGHEIASHGTAHLRATEQSPAEFLDDITRAKKVLEDITGVEVRGYRAPSFSIGHTNPWALDCVAQAGYRYSSSIYPVKHDHYGMPDAPRFPFASRDGLMEVPVTTVRMGSRNLPAGGGGYFRLLPYATSRWLLSQVNKRDGKPAMFYCHPWEIDAEQPRVQGVDAKSRFRHYINLHRTEGRLARLMSDFRWGRMDEVFPEIARAA